MPEVDVDLELSDEDIEELIAIIPPITDQQIEEAFQNISFRVIYQINSFLLPQIKDLIEGREVINVRPEYQRRSRWSPKKKSQLIESLLLNVPIPAVYFYESELARYEVMDGQQRMNAVFEFLTNSFALTGLEKLPFLNRKRHRELPPRVKRSLDRATLSAVVLLQESRSDDADPYVIRRYVFEKLNTGGEKLNAQELRNSLYRSEFNNFIVRLSRNLTFCSIFGIPAYTVVDEEPNYMNKERERNQMYKTMADCQAVLRVFALSSDKHISGSMKTILDRCMERNLLKTSEEIEILEEKFAKVIETSASFFSGHPFLLPPNEKGRQRVSIAYFDAVMVAVWRRIASLEVMKENAAKIAENLDAALVTDLEALTGKANTATAIKERINVAGEAIDAAIR